MEHLSIVVLLLRMEQALMLTDPRGADQSLSCTADHMHDSQTGYACSVVCKSGAFSLRISFHRSFLSCTHCFWRMMCAQMLGERDLLFALCRWPGSVTDGFGDDADDSSGRGQVFEPMRADNNDSSEGSTAAIDFRRSQPGSA